MSGRSNSGQVALTRVLGDLARGGRGARESGVEFLLGEMRAIAEGYLRGGRAEVQATELVNDAYLKLFDRSALDVVDRSHFFALAAKAMRQILVDQARRRSSKKRGGDQCVVTLTEAPAGEQPDVDLLDLDAALLELAELDERQAQVVELRYFAGLEVSEVAEALGVSKSTVERQWRVARAWLGSRIDTRRQA